MVGCLSPFGSTHLSELSFFSHLISCNYLTFPGFFEFNFDAEMVRNIVDFSGFFVRWANTTYELSFFNWTLPTQLIADKANPVVNPGPSITTYSNGYPDLRTLENELVEPWTNIPIGHIP